MAYLISRDVYQTDCDEEKGRMVSRLDRDRETTPLIPALGRRHCAGCSNPLKKVAAWAGLIPSPRAPRQDGRDAKLLCL